MQTIIRECKINSSIEEVFDFFSRAENLDTLTPPELRFKIITPLPIVMRKGTLIDYKIQLNGIGFKWRTEITLWEPPFRFIDTQVKGPYSIWVHEHNFNTDGTATIMKDRIDFKTRGWIFEPVIYKWFVKQNLLKILNYRETKLKNIFNK